MSKSSRVYGSIVKEGHLRGSAAAHQTAFDLAASKGTASVHVDGTSMARALESVGSGRRGPL